MALSRSQLGIANLIYNLATQKGVSPAHARELVATSIAESNLDPGAINRSSGAAGLFQLLSSGYRSRAQQLGGLANPRANLLAILPDYQSYWRTRPDALPGEAGRDVERSGMGAGFYSKPLGMVPAQLGGQPAASPMAKVARPTAGAAPPVNPQLVLAQALLRSSRSGDYQSFFNALRGLQAPQRQGIQQIPNAPLGGRPDVQPLPLTKGQTAPAQPLVHVTHGDQVSPNAMPVIGLARQYLGDKYQWGGASPKTGFDCSGFVQWLYGKQGVPLGRTTYQQIKDGRSVGRGQLQPGDIVFFGSQADPHHEGLYIGHGQFIHSPHTGDVIKISSLNEPYYAQNYVTARRVMT